MKEPTPLSDYYGGATRLITGLPFNNGDEMDQPTFHALYEKCPDGFRAELINGMVVFKMPATLAHAEPQKQIFLWLADYAARTPGTTVHLPLTIKMGKRSEPEPDCTLVIEDGYGGQTWTTDDGYLAGAPELVVEIASTTKAIDLGRKKRDYERSGVVEYVVVLPHDKRVMWFRRRENRFTELLPDPDGMIRSRVFPGLWLNPEAIFSKSPAALLAILRVGRASPEYVKFLKTMKARKEKVVPSSNRNGKAK